MKQMTCEMCGGTDLIKQDSVFVCQTCGTKYSVEEAKKMMIEGKVDVSGSTVQVDSSGLIENYYKMAENAYASNNYVETENYCNRIIEIDSSYYKAWILKGYAAGWQTTVSNLRFEEAINCFSNAINYAPDEEKDAIKNIAADALDNLSLALMDLVCNNFIRYPSETNQENIYRVLNLIKNVALSLMTKCNTIGKFSIIQSKMAEKAYDSIVSAYQDNIKKDYIGATEHPTRATWERYKDQLILVLSLLIQLPEYCNDNETKKKIYEYQIFLYNELINSGSYCYSDGRWVREYSIAKKGKEGYIDRIMECHNNIKKIDPKYVIPQRPSLSGGGCYVATSVYGSYDCPQVWTLRRFRDYELSETCYGRLFIHIYYTVSPSLVKWFGHTIWFKKLWRRNLDWFVKHLQEKGYESTPYKDC